MILAYGSYRHALGEANLTIERDTILSPANLAIGWRERWHIQGRLQAATVEQLSSAIVALESAYRLSGQDAVLYLPDGVTRTAHQLLNSKTYGGVRVTRPPSFPEGHGAEYSTFRTYSIELEAEISDPVPGGSLLEWDEVLTFSGGGPRWAYLPTLFGSPVRQQLQEATAYKVTQSGRAVGLESYPTAASPIWPAAWHSDTGGITRKLPKRSGTVDTRYEVNWTYQFESADALFALPTPRQGS